MASSKDILCPRKECSRKLAEITDDPVFSIVVQYSVGVLSWPMGIGFDAHKLRFNCACGMLGIYDTLEGDWEIGISLDTDAVIVPIEESLMISTTDELWRKTYL